MFKQWFHRVSRQVSRYNAMLKGFERANSQAIDPAMAYVQWGVEQADGGDIIGSIDKFKQAVSLSPNRPEGYTNWGVALAKLGQIEEAIEKFECAIERAPHHATNYMLLGAALLEKGDVQAAAEQYAKASEMDPNNPAPMINHGVALARIGDHTAAIVQFKKALARQKHQPHVHFLWGAALAELGQHQEAIEKYQLTVRYIPKHVEALSFWAVSLNELGQYHEALKKAQDVLTLDAERPDVYLTIGDALANLGQLQPALQAYEQALELDADQVDALVSMGMVHAQLDDWPAAETAFEAAYRINPDDLQIQRAWGLYLVQAAQSDPSQYGLAITHLQPYCQAHPDDVAARIQLASAWIQTNEWELAETTINQLLMLRPNDADILGLNAQLLHHRGQLPAAHEQLEKAYQAEPSAERAVRLAQLYLAQNQAIEAVRLLRPWYRKQPGLLLVTLTYALALRDDGQSREALDKLLSLVTEHPNHFGVLVAVVESYLRRGDYEACLPFLQTLLTRHADQPFTRWLQCWALLQQYAKQPNAEQLQSLQQAYDHLQSNVTLELVLPARAIQVFIQGEQTGVYQAALDELLMPTDDPDAGTRQHAYHQQLAVYWHLQEKTNVTVFGVYPLFGNTL